MINKKLLEQEYYLDKMSLFLKNSYGMIEREEIYRGILNNVNDVGKLIIYSLDIFKEDSEYFDMLGYDANSTEGVMLDLVASLYGVSRNMKVKYSGTEEDLTLTNSELKFYLQVIIKKINYQGIYEDISELYKANSIEYSYTNSLECTITAKDPDKYGTNADPTTLGKLILSDNLLIESLGIIYTKIIGTATTATFDSQAMFDSGGYTFGA